MKIRSLSRFSGVVLGTSVFVYGLHFASAQQGGPRLGDPLPGLSQQELNDFNAWRQTFLRNAAPPDGLGPVFNGVACAECHQSGAPGGAGTNLRVALTTRIGAIVGGEYSDLVEVGGPLIQRRSLRELNPNNPVFPEVVPPQAQFISHRQTTPLFGAGLIDSIPDSVIIAQSNIARGDGIHGVPNMVLNPVTNVMEVGRFGWKAQVSHLNIFAADAMVNELGITNSIFPNENLPQGHAIPPGGDPAPDPEDLGAGLRANTNFMRFLAPPPRALILPARGATIFVTINCTGCHAASMKTGQTNSPALSNKTFAPYSDFLLHDMGPGLDDGVRQGQAQGSQWRTAPLWGLSARTFFLHDGRATTIDDAILAHGGEAQIVRDRYAALPADQKNALIQFLRSL